jgi:hypothetical protein
VQLTLADNLPTFANPNMFDDAIRIWGYEGEDFWYCDYQEARYFENNGTIHVLSCSKDQNYYDICSRLYDKSVSDSVEYVCKPLEFSTQTAVIPDRHPSGVKTGDTLYYSKFVTPNNSYAYTMYMMYLTDQTGKAFISNLTPAIDAIDWLFKSLKSFNVSQYPEWIDYNNILVATKGIMFTILPDFTLSANDSINQSLEGIDVVFRNMGIKSNTNFVEYARDKWTQILVN